MKVLLEDGGRKAVLLDPTPENNAELGQIQSYAFSWRMTPAQADADSGPQAADRPETSTAVQSEAPQPPPSPAPAKIATYAPDGTMVAGLEVVCESVYLRGRPIGHGGIAGVASLPWARRQGNVGMCLVASCHYMRDAGMPLSALYPFSYPFYRRYGWELGQKHITYKVPMHELKPFAKAPGNVERVFLGPDGTPGPTLARLEALYTVSAKTQATSFVRSAHWWRTSVLGDLNATRFACLYVSPQGVDEGYIIYALSRDGNRFSASELRYTTPGALAGLLSYVYQHDSMVETLTWEAPCNSDLHMHLDNPRIEASINMGMQFRVVDVLATLQHLAVDYSGPDFTLCVHDAHLEWNDGVFRVGAGGASRGGSGAVADVEFSIQRLSQAVCAYATPSELARQGMAVAQRPEALAALDDLCSPGPSYVPFMADHF